MPDLKSAVSILGIIIFCCILLSLGAFWGKKVTVSKLVKAVGIVALVAIVVYVIYVAIFLLTGQQ